MTERGLDELARRIAALPRPLLVALDVDGTLAPIVRDPKAARVPAKTRAVLTTLARRRGVRLALVTGRDAAALARLVKVPGAYRALSHGRVVVPPGARVREPRVDAATRARLDAFAAWARANARPRGARLERKAGAFAVHVRALAARAPDAARSVLAAARREARVLGLHARDGRSVVEVEAEAGDKGDALAALARATRARGVLYVGDDLTDVPALRRAVALDGVGVFVRSPERPKKPRGVTAAVDGPEAVAALLARLEGALG